MNHYLSREKHSFFKIISICGALLLPANFTAPGAEIPAPPSGHKIRIVLVGDSTVTDASGCVH